MKKWVALMLMLSTNASAGEELPATPSASDVRGGMTATKSLMDIMYKVNGYQQTHPWKETDRTWVRGTYYTGVMALYRTTRDPAILKQAIAWAEKHQWEIGTDGPPVNRNTCCQTYLELYFLNRQPQRILNARTYVDKRILDVAPGEAITKGWDYVDTLYVGPPALAMLGKATGQEKYYAYLNRAYWEVVDHLFDKKVGLFYRDKRFFDAKTPNGKKVFWSRGNGWAFAGIPRLLEYVPADDPRRERFLGLYKTMAAALIACQPEDGLWRSNLADVDQCPNPETSGTAFFCYGLAWGINEGVLDRKKYLAPALKAWTGLVRHVNSRGRLGYVQQVAASPYPVKADQTHEYAAGLFLLSGSEIHRMLTSGSTPEAETMLEQLENSDRHAPATGAVTNTNDVSVFARNGGWCWFQDPRAIINDGKLLFGSVSGSDPDRGDIRATLYDLRAKKNLGTSVLHRGLESDDHAAPAFYVRPDKRILTVYAYHNGRQHFYRTSAPGDPGTWGPEQMFKHPQGVSYMNLYFQPAVNTLYNFYRDTQATYCPAYMTSTDHGTTWQKGGLLIHHGMKGRHRPYPRYWSDGDFVHISFTEAHPQEFPQAGCSIYYAKFKAGKFFRADGTLIKDLATSGPLLPKEAECIFHGNPSNSAWTSSICVTESGNSTMAYTVRKSRSDHRVRYAHWNGKAWIDSYVGHAGAGLYPAAYDYTGLATIDPSDSSTVWFSTNVDPVEGTCLASGKHEIYKAETSDEGKSWDFVPVTENSASDNLRPICVTGGRWKVLLWLRGRYTTYTDFHQDVVGIVGP